MEACKAHWAHPFVTPVVLLQVHFLRTEEAVGLNNQNVTDLETKVSNIAGFEATAATEKNTSRKRRWGKSSKNQAPHQADEDEDDDDSQQNMGVMSMTNLMKSAHGVLKECIELLDAIRWTERAVKVLIMAGDELEERQSSSHTFRPGSLAPRSAHPNEDQDQPPRSPNFAEDMRADAVPSLFLPNMTSPQGPLGVHWHEIRQYLEGLLRICMSLETERRMSEARCRAQIDIVSHARREKKRRRKKMFQWPKVSS